MVLLQHAINLLNDAADWRLGADVEKWDSWVRVHGEDVTTAIRHGWLSFLAGGLLGLMTLVRSDRLWILVIALPMVGLGYLYNSGAKPLSYTRLGEWVTGLCYGPGVFGCLWLVTGQVTNLSTLLGCAAYGCLAVALLLSHQPPQIRTDREAGKQSFAARYGAVRTYQAVRILFLMFLVSWGIALQYQQPDVVTAVLYLALSCLAFAGTYNKDLGPKYLLTWSSGVILTQTLGAVHLPAGI